MRCRWIYTAWPVSLRTYQAFPSRGRWRGGHAATDEVSSGIHRTTGAAGKNRNISTSSGKQSLPPSPQGEGSARGGSAPHPFPYRMQKAPGYSGGFAADHSLRTFQAFPLRGRWRGGHAATDEVSSGIHRTTGAAGKNRNISTSSGKQSLPPSPQGEGSARGGSAPHPFPYRMQKAPGYSGGFAALLLKTCHAQQNTHNRGGARGGKARLGSDPYRKPPDIVSGGLSASSYSPAAHSVHACLLLPQAQAVGDHGDKLRVRRLALDVRDRVAEKLLQRLNIAAVPRDLDRMPDGALDA